MTPKPAISRQMSQTLDFSQVSGSHNSDDALECLSKSTSHPHRKTINAQHATNSNDCIIKSVLEALLSSRRSRMKSHHLESRQERLRNKHTLFPRPTTRYPQAQSSPSTPLSPFLVAVFSITENKSKGQSHVALQVLRQIKSFNLARTTPFYPNKTTSCESLVQPFHRVCSLSKRSHSESIDSARKSLYSQPCPSPSSSLRLNSSS